MGVVRRCLGCSATYPADDHACPKCGSHAAEVQEEKADRAGAAKPPSPTRRRRKT